MFLGLSLTSWLVILAAFAVITPIVGKQTAKISLAIKDPFNFQGDPSATLILFPNSMLNGFKRPADNCPINKMSEKKYIRWMMVGGVWGKFLLALFTFALFLFIFLAYYLILPLIKTLFSVK